MIPDNSNPSIGKTLFIYLSEKWERRDMMPKGTGNMFQNVVEAIFTSHGFYTVKKIKKKQQSI